MTTYTTTKVMFEELEKKLRRVFKKLDAIGGSYEFKAVREFIKEVPVYTVDPVSQVQYNTHNDVRVECVEYILHFDPYKVGDYRVSAVVEATADENNNLVYCTEDSFDYKTWVNHPITCEHCKTNHRRTKAIVLTNNTDNTTKMVGTACIKDFIGYNVEQFAKYFREIESIVENEDVRIMDTTLGRYKICIDVKTYLAACIREIKDHGYTKTVKTDALYYMKKHDIDKEYVTLAETVIKFFTDYEPDDSFDHNIKAFVTGTTPITSENGFVAYAYVEMNKIIERTKKTEELNKKKAISQFVGNVGQKITFNGILTRVACFEGMYGYTYIYKITDVNNNTFIWKTSKFMDLDGEMKVVVNAIIKEHSEYNGEKQTILTRCKIA